MKVYSVTNVDDGYGQGLGYFTGNPEDIKIYFDDIKCYEISVSEIQIKNISPEMAETKRKLISDKIKLQKQLKELEDKLNN